GRPAAASRREGDVFDCRFSCGADGSRAQELRGHSLVGERNPGSRSSEEGNGLGAKNSVTMDERLAAVRDEVESGSISPQALVLLFNAASDAEHAGDVVALEQTLNLARTIAGMAGENLRAEAERLAVICQQSLASVRERQEAGRSFQPHDGM